MSAIKKIESIITQLVYGIVMQLPVAHINKIGLLTQGNLIAECDWASSQLQLLAPQGWYRETTKCSRPVFEFIK